MLKAENKISFFITVGFLIALFGLFTTFLPDNEVIEIVVKRGETSSEIAEKLKSRGVIKYPILFKSLASLSGKDKEIHPGKYTLPKNLFETRALFILTSQDGHEEIVSLSEGLNLQEIALVLENKVGIDKDRFLHIASDANFIQSLRTQFSLIGGIPNLEGYLFPDTYKLPWGTSEEEILIRMVERFFSKWQVEFTPRAESLGLSIHELVTLASIIEEEAQLEGERPIISRVFHNRLQAKHALEACSTIEYLLPVRKARLSLADLKIDSPYNTYLYPGLPPTPIASPSLESIKAALWPEEGDYFYFVATGDGSHLFAKTFTEHEGNKRRIQNGTQ